MNKSIWHTVVEAPKPWVSIAFYVDGYLYNGYYESEFNKYGIFGADKVEKWCYVKELSSYILTLETENKDLSDKIGKLEIDLEKTHKELEQSEICCTEWEKQALDYKAENIALSGELELTRKTLEVAKDKLDTVRQYHRRTAVIHPDDIAAYCDRAIEQITVEQKDK